jgi:hypothetical protein
MLGRDLPTTGLKFVQRDFEHYIIILVRQVPKLFHADGIAELRRF